MEDNHSAIWKNLMEEQLPVSWLGERESERYEGVTLYEGHSTETCINTLRIQHSAGSLWQTHPLRV